MLNNHALLKPSPQEPSESSQQKNHAQTDPYSRFLGPIATLDDSQVNHPFKHQTQILTMGSSLGLLSSPTLILRAGHGEMEEGF